jgi:hypothetical protein
LAFASASWQSPSILPRQPLLQVRIPRLNRKTLTLLQNKSPTLELDILEFPTQQLETDSFSIPISVIAPRNSRKCASELSRASSAHVFGSRFRGERSRPEFKAL